MFDRQLNADDGFARVVRHGCVLRVPLKDGLEVEAAIVSASGLNRAVDGEGIEIRQFRQDQHGRAGEKGFDHPEHSRGAGEAALRGEHAGLSREFSVHLGHARCGLLVTGDDDLHFVISPVQGLEELHDGPAGQAEKMGHSGFDESIHDHFSGNP